MRLDESYVKALTGRDTQTARHLHQSEFQYAVQFIMVVSTNHLPYISDQTLFKSERVRVIPFERRFKEHEKNKHLIDQLRQPSEASGIFNWLLEGLAAYRQEGLTPPPTVAAAVNAYRLKSDNVSRFMEYCTVEDINGAVPTSALHTAFSAWCIGEGVSTMSYKAFSQAVGERGYKIKSGRYNGSNDLSHVWGVKCTFSNVQN
jgi:putative DNA primase/helicase